MSDTERKPLLEVRNLRVEFPTRRGTLVAVNNISFEISEGEVLGVVGESGAGKSLTGSAVIGLLEPPGRIAGGEILLNGRRIDNLPYREMRKVRGREIGMVFQDPLTSLNPLYTVGRQLVETIQTHTDLSEEQARQRAIDLLAEVGIPAPERRIDQYPHQFSGGMRQRVVIALALCVNPKLVIADEPTTALDVSIQAQIIKLLKRLCREHGAAVMLITHDMGGDRRDRRPRGRDVRRAHRRGRAGEGRGAERQAPLHPRPDGLDPDDRPRHRAADPDRGLDAAADRDPAGLRLQSALPACLRPLSGRAAGADTGGSVGGGLLAVRRRREEGGGMSGTEEQMSDTLAEESRQDTLLRETAEGQPLLQVHDLARYFDVSPPWLNRVLQNEPRALVKAVDGVSFEIPRGKTFSLVGESGCGKSTVARLVVGLYQPTRGTVRFEGVDMATLKTRKQQAPLRRRFQMIFQDPYASLNPRWRVADIIAEPIRAHGIMSDERQISRRVGELLEQVRLSARDGEKFPHEFSGGQRQRISIARALASNPEFLVCDEPTSALDVSVQAQILNLMKELQTELGLTYLFISHDLAVVYHISDYVGVMYLGRLVEWGDARRVFFNPQHPYTRMLLDAIPDLEMTGRERIPGGRRGAQPDPSAERLPLPSALSLRRRALPQRGAAEPGPGGRRGRCAATRSRRGRLPPAGARPARCRPPGRAATRWPKAVRRRARPCWAGASRSVSPRFPVAAATPARGAAGRGPWRSGRRAGAVRATAGGRRRRHADHRPDPSSLRRSTPTSIRCWPRATCRP